MSDQQGPRKWNRRIWLLPLFSIIVAALVVSLVFSPIPTISASFGSSADSDYSIKYISIGVYSSSDIGTWELANENEIFEVNPENTLNIVEVRVEYDPNGVIDYQNIGRSIFITMALDDGNEVTTYNIPFYSNNLGRAEAVFKKTGINFDFEPGVSYIMTVTYKVVIK